MRMRKLGHGQSLLFIAPQEVDWKIRKAASKSPSDVVRSSDILRWVMQETCADIQHHTPHWCQQGIDYLRRKEDWSKFCSSTTTDTSILKHSWLQPESRTLEYMYGIRESSNLTSTISIHPEIQERCRKLGVTSFQDTRMEEEQEREVSHEIERERQVERPPKAKPAIHHIHERVREFIRTGEIRGEFQGDKSPFFPIHIAAKNPSAWSQNLLLTHDFKTTIQGADGDHGDYLRPVNWIVSSALSGATALVVVSPHEANELLPDIRCSQFVHLHQYTPRVTKTMISFDDLRFYCIPPLPSTWMAPSANLLRQLNLFAGQLYLLDYDEYQQLCTFLGLYSRKQQAADNAQIESDGFVIPIHRHGTLAHLQVCRFQESPLRTLKDLIGHRRKGMNYASTHIGKVLHARLLTMDDFDLTDDGKILTRVCLLQDSPSLLQMNSSCDVCGLPIRNALLRN